jgi:hypothetical protein
MQLGTSLADSLATQILFDDTTTDDTSLSSLYPSAVFTKAVSGTGKSNVEKPRLRLAFESPEL